MRAELAAGVAAVVLWCAAPAAADPAPGGGSGGGPIVGGGGGGPDIIGGRNISPGASAATFLCPGVGTAVNVLGAGGGYCDFDFEQIALPGPPGIGVMHIHCEWGGFSPIAAEWNCWRVWPGRSDHPRLPDPDVIPDGWVTPWGLNGPSPADQWPPPGLAPAPPPAEPPPP